MTKLTRRHFLKTSVIAAGALSAPPQVLSSEKKNRRSATDIVNVGSSGLRLTRLGFGTGSNGGHIQRELGQEKFTRLVRAAYDRGVRYFDTADNYNEMHEMLATALEGVDRDTYFIQTKMRWNGEEKTSDILDRFRKELKTDHFDSVLLHCTATADWPEKLKRLQDDLEQAKEKQILIAHGASCHGLNPLKAMPKARPWLDVALLRVNHDGTKMDGPKGEWNEQGRRDEAVAEIQKIHQSGAGVIGMKIIGNGEFTAPERRDASFRFVMGLDCVDAVVIGFKTASEIDEAIERMNHYLNV